MLLLSKLVTILHTSDWDAYALYILIRVGVMIAILAFVNLYPTGTLLGCCSLNYSVILILLLIIIAAEVAAAVIDNQNLLLMAHKFSRVVASQNKLTCII